MFSGLSASYDQLWKAIVRPPREIYATEDLGPVQFSIAGREYKRTDKALKNNRNLSLKCSHFEPSGKSATKLPCLIMLHGNCSSRLSVLPVVSLILPMNISLFCFDFAGCGLSDGEYISLGWFERDDLAMVVEYLRSTGTVGAIGIWGRSMGAVTALMHADRDPSIAGMVLDSSFTCLTTLAEELANKQSNLPGFILKGCLALIRSSIKKRAKFDITALRPIDHVRATFIPALFGAAKQDDFVRPSHSQELFNDYAGDKNIIYMDGDHNSPRPQSFYDSAAVFLYNTLGAELHPLSVIELSVDPDDELLRKVIHDSLLEANPGLTPEELDQLSEENFHVFKGM